MPAQITSVHPSVIVHGPQGCGKTLHGDRLARHFGLRAVVEADDLTHDLPKAGALILTQQRPGPEVRRQLTFAQAMKLLEGKPGYPF
ncbi:MAG: hypothetical protein Q8N13_10995 [Acidovorax sp.]|nr:hypothetical protein [Acidovorax sp.]